MTSGWAEIEVNGQVMKLATALKKNLLKIEVCQIQSSVNNYSMTARYIARDGNGGRWQIDPRLARRYTPEQQAKMQAARKKVSHRKK